MIKIKYTAVMWNEHAKHHFSEWTKPETEIEAIDENAISVDGIIMAFPSNGIMCTDIREQTNGVIEDAHRDDNGVLCLEVRRFFTKPGGELAWYSENYVDVEPSYRPRGKNVIQIKMLTQSDIDAAEAKKQKDERLAEILAELDAIDKKKVRPLTAFILKEETKDDTRILKKLDKKAKELREEKKLLEEIK